MGQSEVEDHRIMNLGKVAKDGLIPRYRFDAKNIGSPKDASLR